MEKLVAGQEVEIPGFILVGSYGEASHCTIEMQDQGYTTVMPHTVKFTVPATFNAVAAEVAAIEKKLDKMADTYHSQVRNLKERIESLLCIEMAVPHKPVQPPDFSGDDDIIF